MVAFLILFAGVLCSLPAMPSIAQNAGRGATAAQPAPRGPDGRVLLGPRPGEKGVWQGDGRLANNPNSYEPRASANVPLHIDNIPLQPWARAIVNERHAEFLRFEPHARCKASGGPREFVTPYGFEIVEMPALQRITSSISEVLIPFGQSIWMDGNIQGSHSSFTAFHRQGSDTLSHRCRWFNEKFWMSRMAFRTDRCTTEKFTQIDLFKYSDCR
jgi:hypothetical protein